MSDTPVDMIVNEVCQEILYKFIDNAEGGADIYENLLRGIVQRNLTAANQRISELEKERDLLNERASILFTIERLKAGLLDINEYWNGGNGSAVDAAQHACDVSEALLNETK